MDEISPSRAQQMTIQAYDEHIEEYIQKDHGDDGRTAAYWVGLNTF